MNNLSSHPSETEHVSVREVSGASSASLTLRGTVLVHKATTWAGRTSLLIPIECLSVSRTRRYDRRYLVQGLRILLACVLISLTLGLPLAWEKGDLRDAPAWFLWTIAAAAVGAVGYFIFTITRFFRRRSAIRFEADVYDGRVTIECWDVADELDGLVKRIDSVQRRIDELVPYPARHSYELFHLHPFRVSLMQAFLFTIMLYVPVRFAVHYTLVPWLYLFLLLPGVVYVGRYLFEHFRMLMQPLEFQEAVSAYDREDLDTARRKLDVLLAEWPDYIPGLLLYAQVCTLLQAYTAAYQACDKLEDVMPDLGAPLRDEILGIERLQRRMDDAV